VHGVIIGAQNLLQQLKTIINLHLQVPIALLKILQEIILQQAEAPLQPVSLHLVAIQVHLKNEESY